MTSTRPTTPPPPGTRRLPADPLVVAVIGQRLDEANIAAARFNAACQVALASVGITEALPVLGIDGEGETAALLVPALPVKPEVPDAPPLDPPRAPPPSTT